MPRIDPLQLINCLQVLLSPNGGILSNHEVHRLNTETVLLDSFMNAGGWTLIQLWLHDGMYTMNWALVKELLELLLITPVDVERLKSNNIPKLVKSLSKREDLEGVHELSSQLVQQWLKIVKGETNCDQKPSVQHTVTTVIVPELTVPQETSFAETALEESVVTEQNEIMTVPETVDTQTFYKVTVKDGKQVFSKIDPNEEATEAEVVENIENTEPVNEFKELTELEKSKKDDKKKSHERSKHRSSSKSSGSNTSSKDRDKSSHKDKDRRSSSSKSSKDKDRGRDKDKNDKDRHSKSNGSVKSSSKSSSSKDKDKKDSKEKQAEKDKDTLAKVLPQSIDKLPKIPKKSSDEKIKKEPIRKEDPKKGSISIEVRKNSEERPKTVKVFKSKMRSTGLEEEAKPPPPRPVKKPGTTPPVVIPPVPLKRPSPIRDLPTPPEKKTRIETPLERPGAIKLIPPKPKPSVLQESDMFMDALAASATAKKEPKKRKRRASTSKDTPGSPPVSPTNANTNQASSPPIGLKNIAPPKFYQDTLETNETENLESADKENTDVNKTDEKEDLRSNTPTENMEESEDNAVPSSTGLKGVLVYIRKKGPKKTIKWKPDDELVDIQYFELDETERVNVTKTFGDLAKMDVRSEREALQLSRKTIGEDVMDVQTIWRIPMEIDLPELLAMSGCKSLEKDIQFAREKSVLQALYFNKKMLPDSPMEPDPENYQIKDPVIIPIEDIDNPEHDFRNKPWPEPKGSPPPQNIPNNLPPMFNANPPMNFPNFAGVPPPNFQNVQHNMPSYNGPPFGPPNMMGGSGGEWNNMNMPHNMQNPPMMPNMGPPEMMNQGPPMNPNMFMGPPGPPENFNPMMNDGNHRFPPPFNPQHQGPPPPGVFPPPNNFSNRGGFGGFRRGGSGSGPWVRMNGPGPNPGGWNNIRGGGAHRGGRLCNNVRNKGFCRNRDTCPFFHPN